VVEGFRIRRLAKVIPENLPKLFKNYSGISGCARFAAKRKPKRTGTGTIGPEVLARDVIWGGRDHAWGDQEHLAERATP
jgi:hypothetical protein